MVRYAINMHMEGYTQLDEYSLNLILIEMIDFYSSFI